MQWIDVLIRTLQRLVATIRIVLQIVWIQRSLKKWNRVVGHRCPTYERPMPFAFVGRASSPAKRVFQRSHTAYLTDYLLYGGTAPLHRWEID